MRSKATMVNHKSQSGLTLIFSECLVKGLLLVAMPLLVAILTLGCEATTTPTEEQNSLHAARQQTAAFIASLDTMNATAEGKSLALRQYFDGLSLAQKAASSEVIFKKLYGMAAMSPDSSLLPYLQKQASLGRHYPIIQISSLLSQAAYWLYANQQPDSGLACLRTALNLQDSFNDSTYKSYYTLFAQALYQKGAFQQAADYYLKAIKIADKQKDSVVLIGNYGNLAALYSSMDEEQKAIPLKKICLTYFSSHQDLRRAFTSYVSLGRSYYNADQTDSAFYYYNQALILKNEGVSNPSVELVLLTNLGVIHYQRGQIQEAAQDFDNCQTLLTNLQSPEQQLIFTIFSAPTYEMTKGVFSQDLAALQQATHFFSQQNNLNLVKAGYNSLYEISLARKDYQSALHYYKAFDSISQVITSSVNTKYINQLRTDYEVQKRENTIFKQQKEITKKTAYNQVLALLLVCGLAVAALGYVTYRLRKKKNETAQQRRISAHLLASSERQRSQLARELHDSLGQDILVIKHQLSRGEDISTTKIDELLDKVRTLSRNFHPIMLDQIGLKESIIHISQQISEQASLFISTEIEYEANLEKEQELQLFRIFQEGLNNIVKHAGAEAARLELHQVGAQLLATIRDNGKGFDALSALKSADAFGLHSMIERTKSLNGQFNVQSSSKGTLINIKIPLHG